MKIGIYYFRSLYSQSACSLSVGKFSDFLLNRGYNVKLGILKNNDYAYNRNELNDIIENDIIIYKTNYKDFEYGIRFFENLKKIYTSKKIYLTGPFANLNKERIIEKYKFIENIINMQNITEIEENFPIIGKAVQKDTIVCGIDRQMEFLEKGKYINLEASTGCIYNCAFCHINILNYTKNVVDVKMLVDEIEFLVNKMGKKYLIFNDSVFWKNEQDTERILKIIEEVKKRNLKFYFMIYLSLTSKIPLDLLEKLKEIGLIRVFFGVENISKRFQKANNKYVSEEDTKQFIKVLEEKEITYHIGFILFSYETTYEELFLNLKFLKDIKKLFRPGMIVEKMRILPKSQNSKLLYENKEKIDQAYNYKIQDDNTEKCHKAICDYFSNINIRDFEHFFSSTNIAISILKRKGKESNFEKEIQYYNKVLNTVNEELYNILNSIFEKFTYSEKDKSKLLDLYSKAEIMYIDFTEKLRNLDPDIFMMLPHGKEEINI